MNKATILVTGGAGYIGSITVKKLIENGYKVIVVDSLENGHRKAVDSRAELIVADLKNKQQIGQVFKSYQIDAVIDFAAYLSVGESMEKPIKYLKNNILNFIQLLDIMVENGCNFIVKSSTAAVYGNPLNEGDFPVKEDYTRQYRPKNSCLLQGDWEGESVQGNVFFNHLLSWVSDSLNSENIKLEASEIDSLRIPLSVYGFTKILDEILLERFRKRGLKFVTLRYFNVCGADFSGNIGEAKPQPTTLMTLGIYAALGRLKELMVFGNDYSTADGTGLRDYIHVCDLADGHISALQYLLDGGESDTFNLGTGLGSTVLEVIKAIERSSGKKILYKFVPRRSGDPAVSYADVSKARQILKWQAKYDLNEMARTAWNWHVNFPNGY